MALNPKEVTIPQLPRKPFSPTDFLIITDAVGTSAAITGADLVEDISEEVITVNTAAIQPLVDAAAASAEAASKYSATGRPVVPTSVPATDELLVQATQAGTYTNFGGLVVSAEEIKGFARLVKLGSVWSKDIKTLEIGTESLGSDKIKDQAVIASKTDFLTPGKNKFNILDPENLLNGFIDSTTGAFTVSVNHRTTHYIKVSPGEPVYYSSGTINGARVAYYDANKIFISGALLGGGQVIPSGVSYVRASINVTTQVWETFQVENGVSKTPFAPFNLILSESGGVTVTANKSVSAEISDDINPLMQINRKSIGYIPGKNLANILGNDVSLGFFVQYDTGNLFANVNYNTTEYIDVLPETAYTLSYKHQIAWYNEDKVYISGSNSTVTTKTQTSPAGAAFLRCSVNLASWTTFQVEEGSVQTIFTSHELYIDKLQGSEVFAKRVDPDAVLAPKNLSLVAGKNLFNKTALDVEIGKILSAGTTSANVNYNVTGYIPVEASQQYTVSWKHNISWFDAGKVYLSQSTSSDFNRTQTAPLGAAFLRCAVNFMEWDLFQVEKGSVRSKYQPYAYVLDTVGGLPVIADNITDEDVITFPVIAPKVYVPLSKEVVFYSENVYKYYEDGRAKTELTLTGVPSANIVVTDRGLKFKQASGLSAISASLKSYTKEYLLLNSLDFVVQPVNPALTTAKKVMNIGDSYTLRESFIDVIAASAGATGLSFHGMRLSTASTPVVNHEGRGGWSMNSYHVTNTSLFSPFWQPQAPYKYFGNTSYWINAVNNPVIGANNENYDWGNVDPAIRALFSGTTGLLIAPALNDVIYVNADSAYKRWDGSAWVAVTGLTWSFNFAKYRTLFACPVIDIVHIMLGTNDFAGTAPRDFNSIYYFFRQQMNNMIASMKTDNASIKIIVGIPVSSGKQGEIGTYETERRKIIYWMLAKSLIADYGNREAEGILLSDYHSTVDRVYGYGSTDILPFESYTGTQRNRFMSDYVHINADGFKQMGNVYMGIIQSLR